MGPSLSPLPYPRSLPSMASLRESPSMEDLRARLRQRQADLHSAKAKVASLEESRELYNKGLKSDDLRLTRGEKREIQGIADARSVSSHSANSDSRMTYLSVKTAEDSDPARQIASRQLQDEEEQAQKSLMDARELLGGVQSELLRRSRSHDLLNHLLGKGKLNSDQKTDLFHYAHARAQREGAALEEVSMSQEPVRWTQVFDEHNAWVKVAAKTHPEQSEKKGLLGIFHSMRLRSRSRGKGSQSRDSSATADSTERGRPRSSSRHPVPRLPSPGLP